MAAPEQLHDGYYAQYLYRGFHQCRWCRFYSSNAYRVAMHETRCGGQTPRAWCLSCRFDGVDLDEVRVHRASGDCVDEQSHIIGALYTLDYVYGERRL